MIRFHTLIYTGPAREGTIYMNNVRGFIGVRCFIEELAMVSIDSYHFTNTCYVEIG